LPEIAELNIGHFLIGERGVHEPCRQRQGHARGDGSRRASCPRPAA
jgi:hypothetical protein